MEKDFEKTTNESAPTVVKKVKKIVSWKSRPPFFIGRFLIEVLSIDKTV
jgi:hypothetical protein